MDSKGSFDLCSDQFRSLNGQELVDISPSAGDSLESHVPCCTVCTNVRLLVVDSKNAVLDGGPNKAISLTIPREGD